jgi:hypothetical protein
VHALLILIITCGLLGAFLPQILLGGAVLLGGIVALIVLLIIVGLLVVALHSHDASAVLILAAIVGGVAVLRQLYLGQRARRRLRELEAAATAPRAADRRPALQHYEGPRC